MRKKDRTQPVPELEVPTIWRPMQGLNFSSKLKLTHTDAEKDMDGRAWYKKFNRNPETGKKIPTLTPVAVQTRKGMESFAATNTDWEPASKWINEHVWDWSQVIAVQGQYDFSNATRIRLQSYQKRILDHVLTPYLCECTPSTSPCENHKLNRVGKFKYSRVIWSQPKKHGKTQIAAAVGAWWSCKIQSPDIVMTMASNREQSTGLIFNSLMPTLKYEGGKVPASHTSVPQIKMPNGTLLKAIPNNYAGQAGGNYGLTLWSELWTYKTERDRKLFDECPPVPTRFNSVQWIETYAGFEDESDLLLDLFSRIFVDTKESAVWEHSEAGNPIEPVPELRDIVTKRAGSVSPSCYHIPKEKFFMFWDHEIRAPWITQDYIDSERASTRKSTFIRLWKNQWQTSEGTYIDPELVDAAVTLEPDNVEDKWSKMVLAGDASQRHDHTALVGVQKKVVTLFGKRRERYRLVHVKSWDPKKEGVKKGSEMHKLGAKIGDLDLTGLIALQVKSIYDRGLMDGPFYYDPAQLQDVAMQLRKLKVPCVEFSQGSDRLAADTFLWRVIKNGDLDLFPSVVVDHLKNANAKEAENEMVRIIKGTATENRKVDAAVALSMAVWRASTKIDRDRKRRTSASTSMFS